MMSMMGGDMVLNMILWIIVLGLVIYGIVLLISKPFEKKKMLPCKFLENDLQKVKLTNKNLRIKRPC